MIPKFLEAQAYFSTTQTLFSSSSDKKKQTCISKYFFQKRTYFPSKNMRGTQGPSNQNVKISLQVKYEL